MRNTFNSCVALVLALLLIQVSLLASCLADNIVTPTPDYSPIQSGMRAITLKIAKPNYRASQNDYPAQVTVLHAKSSGELTTLATCRRLLRHAGDSIKIDSKLDFDSNKWVVVTLEVTDEEAKSLIGAQALGEFFIEDCVKKE